MFHHPSEQVNTLSGRHRRSQGLPSNLQHHPPPGSCGHIRTLQGVGVVLSPTYPSCHQASPQGTTCMDKAVSTPHRAVTCLLLRPGKRCHPPFLVPSPYSQMYGGGGLPPQEADCVLCSHDCGAGSGLGLPYCPQGGLPRTSLLLLPSTGHPCSQHGWHFSRAQAPLSLALSSAFTSRAQLRSQPLPDTLPRGKQAPRTKITIR